MKAHVFLGIGIGIILTSIVFSFNHKEKIDINKLVEVEVQKKLKEVKEIKSIDNDLKKTIKNIETTKTAIETVETVNNNLNNDKLEYDGIYFKQDKSSEILFYVLITRGKDNEKLVNLQKKIEKILPTTLEVINGQSIIFSKYAYTVEKSNDIEKIMKSRFNLDGKKIKINELEKKKKELAFLKYTYSKSIPKKTVKKNTTVIKSIEKKEKKSIKKVSIKKENIVEEKLEAKNSTNTEVVNTTN